MTRNTRTKFNDIDDSSDEETVKAGIKKHNVGSALALVKKHIAAKTSGGLKKLNEEDLKKVELSFMMQSLGVEMFYSERVNQNYYKKKERILSGSQIVSPGEQKEWVEENLKASFEQLFYQTVSDKHSELYQLYQGKYVFLDNFLKKYPNFFEEITQDLLSKAKISHTLYCAANSDFTSHPSFIAGGKFAQLEKNLLDYINKLASKEAHDLKKLKSNLEGYLYNAIDTIFNNLIDHNFLEKMFNRDPVNFPYEDFSDLLDAFKELFVAYQEGVEGNEGAYLFDEFLEFLQEEENKAQIVGLISARYPKFNTLSPFLN